MLTKLFLNEVIKSKGEACPKVQQTVLIVVLESAELGTKKFRVMIPIVPIEESEWLETFGGSVDGYWQNGADQITTKPYLSIDSISVEGIITIKFSETFVEIKDLTRFKRVTHARQLQAKTGKTAMEISINPID